MVNQTVRPPSHAPLEMEILRLPDPKSKRRTSVSWDGSDQSQPRPLHMAVEKTLLWTNGQTLLVKFLDGSEDIHEMVKKAAQIWEKYAHIQFKFVDAGPSDIRISFDQCGGSFSFVGTEARMVPHNRATMNLAIANMKSQMVERHILHELGHTLGCIHEHCSPAAEIPWNKEHVYSYFKGLGWNKETVDENLFREYAPGVIEFSLFDSMSIMMYSLETAFTKDGYTARFGWDLSKTDKEFISRVYPKPKKSQVSSSDGVED